MSVPVEQFVERGALAALLADIDDYCGTPPHPPIPHLPWLRDVLVGVAVARLVGTLEGSPLRAEFQELSSTLVKNGFERAGSNPMPGIAKAAR